MTNVRTRVRVPVFVAGSTPAPVVATLLMVAGRISFRGDVRRQVGAVPFGQNPTFRSRPINIFDGQLLARTGRSKLEREY